MLEWRYDECFGCTAGAFMFVFSSNNCLPTDRSVELQEETEHRAAYRVDRSRRPPARVPPIEQHPTTLAVGGYAPMSTGSSYAGVVQRRVKPWFAIVLCVR